MSLLTILCTLFSCNTSHADFKSVTPDEFAQVIADSTVIRLDVRTAEEYADGHIEGALNIDVNGADFLATAEKQLDKQQTVALYCRSGRRSKKAADILSNAGFNIVELNNGYLGWIGVGKPVVK